MGKRLGLLIGINEYQHPAFQSSQFAENDARALAQWLVNSRGGNWNPSDLQLLLGAHATSELTEALITQFCVNVADPGDLVFLYFAGHTFLSEANGDGYLAFANTHYQQPATGLPLQALVRQSLLRSRAAQIIVVLDCFQTGPTWSSRRSSPFDFKPLLDSTLHNALQQTQGRLLYCSCRGNQSAPEVGEKNLGNLVYHMIIGLIGPASDPVSGQMTLQNLHAFLSSSLDEQHQPQVFGYEQRPIVLVGDMPPLASPVINGQENISTSSPSSPVQNSAIIQPPSGSPLAGYPQQSSVGIASAQMSPSTSGQLSFEILEYGQGLLSPTIAPVNQGGPKSFLISATIQLLALIVGAIGASILIVRPQLPIIIAFILESSALAVLCVTSARGTSLYGAKRLLLSFVISLLALGLLGGLYRFGYRWFANKVIAFPPLIVPVLFLGLWLVAAAILPLLAALGGLIGRITIGRKHKTLSS